MAGSSTFSPPPIPLALNASTVLVASYDRTRSPGARYTLVPNVRCERVEYREGAGPPAAQFSYIVDTSDPTSPYPAFVEQLWPLTASGSYIASVGEELVVFVFDDQGAAGILFHGVVDNPQANVQPGGQALTFTATGIAVRCFDLPRTGAYYCPATNPNAQLAILTDLEERFNPDGEPNATPDGQDVNQGAANAFPAFLDWRLNRTPDPRRAWTLSMFARYLMYTRPADDLKFVDNPTINFAGGLDAYLVAIEPASGDTGTIDLANPASYTTQPITIDDVIASDRAWPEILATTLERYGFAMKWVVNPKDVGAALPEPSNSFEIYRKDALFAPAPKTIRLQNGGVLNPGASNAASLTLVRDSKASVNSFFHVARPNRYEASIVLSPGFLIASADASNPDQFSSANLVNATADVRKKFRLFVADEGGDGHWDYALAAWTTAFPCDLSAVLGRPVQAVPQWVPRLRPGIDPLFSADARGVPRRADLSISTNYAGAYPAVWDGSGAWQSVGRSGWELLDDRLGIAITQDNPNDWKISPPPAGSPGAVKGDVVRVVESLASPGTAGGLFSLRLTVVIEGDHVLDSLAAKRTCVPVPWTTRRRIDARDIYQKNVVDASSVYSGGAASTPRDDSQTAAARSRALRAKNEFPAVSARVTIPGVSSAYFIGDRLSSVDGRGISLQANAGTGAGEGPSYPFVVSGTYDFGGDAQNTILELTDARS